MSFWAVCSDDKIPQLNSIIQTRKVYQILDSLKNFENWLKFFAKILQLSIITQLEVADQSTKHWTNIFKATMNSLTKSINTGNKLRLQCFAYSNATVLNGPVYKQMTKSVIRIMVSNWMSGDEYLRNGSSLWKTSATLSK